MALLLLVAPLQGCGRGQSRAAAPLQATAPAGPLQEVAPPPGVAQLSEALAERSPQVRILAPAAGTTLPEGPWTLRLQVRDWPLADAGELGLGAHVVVQLDDGPPQRLSQTGPGASEELSLTMAPLAPGSHRLTAYAARPWGEAVKQPGAFSQIQLQRVAPTQLRVPAPGTPQLIAVSPGPEPRPEPVLLDWLLLDAPLQGLRQGDGSWRLRVSVNGDSFLVDQNTPLWLKGWRNGSNSLQLDLVDGRGEPLNPPFNSLVAEAVVQTGAPRPAWLSRLDPLALARLLGQAPPPAPAEPTPAPEPEPEPEPEASPALTPETAPESTAAAAPASASAAEPAPVSEPEPEPEAEPQPISQTAGQAQQDDANDPAQPTAAPLPAAEPEPEPPPSPKAIAPAGPAAIANPERVAPRSSLSGSARQQVREDGSLIQEQRRGPLAGLRQRLSS